MPEGEQFFIFETFNQLFFVSRKEISHLKVPSMVRSATLSFSMVSSRVIMYFSFILYLILMDTNERFRPEIMFVSVTLFERLRYSLTWTFPQAYTCLLDFMASCNRIDELVSMPEHCAKSVENTYDPTKPIGITVNNLTTKPLCFGTKSQENNKFQLRNLSFNVASPETLYIIGPVGCGKVV